MAIPSGQFLADHQSPTFSKSKSTGACLCDNATEKGYPSSSPSRASSGAHHQQVFFAVRAQGVRPWERMFVVGGNAELGDWRPEGALEMVREEEDGAGTMEEKREERAAKNEDDPQEQSSVWRASIQLCPGAAQCLLRFRYFVGFRLQSDPTSLGSPLSLCVARWECNAVPRCILPAVEANSRGECSRGVVNEFGTYSGHDRMVMDGWLNTPEQRQIFLRMFGTALRFFDAKLGQRRFLVRVSPCDVRMDQEFNFNNSRGPVSWRTPSLYMRSLDSLPEEDNNPPVTSVHTPLPSHSCTEIANLLCDQDPLFREQSEHGQLFQNNGEDYFVFRTTSIATEFLAFRIELFMVPQRNWTNGESKVGLSPSRFAIAYCMPSAMPDTFGSLSLPMIAVKTQRPVGQLKADYLLATPVEWSGGQPEANRMESTFAKHWKKRRTLEVGHRGSGESFTKFASARENTIFSLNNAAQRGADFVEFDVQLSRDRSVVIFHDFHVLVSVAKRSGQHLDPANAPAEGGLPKSRSEADVCESAEREHRQKGDEMHQIALRDLSLEQLRLLQVHHYKLVENGKVSANGQGEFHPLTGDPDEALDLRPFPTLNEALLRVDEHTGFNVEIKYPMRMKDGTHECENYFERNQYVDRVLVDVFSNAGKRRIVFSSFDPDICTLLSVKQSRYPVLFLCVGQTARYVPFLDERSNVSRIGTNFAACSNLLGINLHSEELLSDPGPLQRAIALKLIVFVWGEDLGSPEHVAYFRRQNVNAIIYDRVGELETRQNVFVVEREAKSALFRRSPRSSPTLSRTNSFFHSATPSPPPPATLSTNDGLPRQMTIAQLTRQMTIANSDF